VPILSAMSRFSVAAVGAGLAAAILAFGVVVDRARAARPARWVAPGTAKVRPDDGPPHAAPPAAIQLRVLRGECELAHLALAAGDAPIPGVLAAVEGALPGVTIRLYREVQVELPRPSGPDGAAGRWPDPLVPAIDAVAGEARRAFPFTVPARETRAIAVEACADGAAAPGPRRATLRLDAGPLAGPVPLVIRVERAALPATAGLPTSFGFSALRAALGHYGRPGTPAEIAALDRAYRTVLLAHRISAHGGTMQPPPFRRGPDGIVVDFRDYDREVGPFLEGKVLPGGARATTVELRTHPALATDEDRVAYWRAIAAHHRERGWNAILFDYAKDEPKREDLPAVAAHARLVRRADPSIRILLTAPLEPSLVGLVDLWTPNLNCLFTRSRPDEYCPWRAPRSAYRDPWWYVSCSSSGCGEGPKGSYFAGWPGYAIDLPGARARAMGWLAFREGIGGELYWDTVYGYAPVGRPGDPWTGAELRAFGVNGDGTLFYPGTPARIGGATQIPVESLRLKQIRDGLEDHDLLRLVAARPGGDRAVRRELERLVPGPWSIEPDPSAWEAARDRLLDVLAQAAAPSGPAGGE
jgi:hypothetical protein